MARTTRTGRRPARGSFGQWSTEDRTGGVREHRGWDAATLAVIDGGGCLRPTNAADTDAGSTAGDDTRRRTTSHRTARTTRKAGRR